MFKYTHTNGIAEPPAVCPVVRRKSINIPNHPLLPHYTKCRSQKAQDISLKLSGSQRLIQVPKGKSEAYLLQFLVACTACAINSWRSKGNKCRSPRTRIHTPCFCSFSLIRKKREGWDRVCRAGEVIILYQFLSALLCIRHYYTCLISLPPFNNSERSSLHSPLYSRKLSFRWDCQIGIARGHRAIRCSIRTETQVCLIMCPC